MEPLIEYAKTPDGVRIATMSVGEGETTLLIAATPPWSHVELEYRIAPVRKWTDALAARLRVVRYDCRGTGLSDRDTSDFSVEAQARDLAAVADHYGLRRFAIWGSIGGSPAAIRYAAQYPGRVSHLLLWAAFLRGDDVYGQAVQGMGPLLRDEWEIYTDTYAQIAFGWPEAETAAQYAALMRAAITQSAAFECMRALVAADATDGARAIASPTLVLARRDAKFAAAGHARELAGAIPGARMILLEGDSPAPFLGDADAVIDAITSFVSSPQPGERTTGPQVELTDRERQVLRLLAGGATAKEIAVGLGVSVATAQRHTANIYAKIGARGRVDATAWAIDRGLAPRRA